MKRRGFLGMLVGLPFVGKLVAPAYASWPWDCDELVKKRDAAIAGYDHHARWHGLADILDRYPSPICGAIRNTYPTLAIHDVSGRTPPRLV